MTSPHARIHPISSPSYHSPHRRSHMLYPTRGVTEADMNLEAGTQTNMILSFFFLFISFCAFLLSF